MKIFEREYLVPFFDCDKLRQMTPTAMINQMILTSVEQLETSGFGEKWMASQNQGWVVTQYDLLIERIPFDGEKVTISTWIENYNKFFSYRNFAIDSLTGERLVTLKSVWVILDLKERKLKVLPEEMMVVLEAKKNVVVRTPKISVKAEKFDHHQRYNIRYADLDTNNHITNTSYINWVCESLGIDFLAAHQLRELQIRYEKEIQDHDFIDADFYQVQNSEQLKFYHQVSRQNKLACLAMTIWH